MLDNLGYRHTLRVCNNYFLLFHSKNAYAKAPECYVTHILTVLCLLVSFLTPSYISNLLAEFLTFSDLTGNIRFLSVHIHYFYY
jgi:hypothetical protein